MDASSINLLVGLLIGFLLTVIPRWFDRKRNLSGYWKVLRVEIEYCHKGALDIQKLAPLGRLPTAIYDEVFKHIVAEAEIEADEARMLIKFYDLVRQVNDSLDLVAAAFASGDQTRAMKESSRTRLKIAKFAVNAEDSYYAPAIALANSHCSKPWWKF